VASPAVDTGNTNDNLGALEDFLNSESAGVNNASVATPYSLTEEHPDIYAERITPAVGISPVMEHFIRLPTPGTEDPSLYKPEPSTDNLTATNPIELHSSPHFTGGYTAGEASNDQLPLGEDDLAHVGLEFRDQIDWTDLHRETEPDTKPADDDLGLIHPELSNHNPGEGDAIDFYDASQEPFSG
jgi:hypothetical protein